MWKKAKIDVLCKEAAEQFPDWTFLKGEGRFVKKYDKWLKLKIAPGFRYWPQATVYRVVAAISIPTLEKEILSHVYEDNIKLTFVSPLRSVQGERGLGELEFSNEGDVPSEAEVVAEIASWIPKAECYFKEHWDLSSEASVFESAVKLWDGDFRGSFGLKLCAFAAFIGRFDFVDAHFTDDVESMLRRSGPRFKAMLPELKQSYLQRENL